LEADGEGGIGDFQLLALANEEVGVREMPTSSFVVGRM